MKVKIKRLSVDSIIPKYAKNGDAGMDLTATHKWIDGNGNITYGTGWAFEIPEGYVGLLFPRSSVSKKDLVLANSIGVIDSEYRGEVLVKFKTTSEDYKDYGLGERVCQLIILPYPQVELIESEELSDTDRGEDGFGSTGK